MSSYRGGAWDGGPPGAEADYAPNAPMPTTDPWTGVSYSQYGQQSSYDYNSYGASNIPTASGYGFNYNSGYYQRQDGNYYGKYSDSTYPSHLSQSYPPRPRSRSLSPVDNRSHKRRGSYRSHTRSISPRVKRERSYSRKEGTYDDGIRKRHSRSRSINRKNSRYSSSDRSGSSSSTSHTSYKAKKKRKSVSSSPPISEKTYRTKKAHKAKEESLTPPPRKRSSSKSSDRSRTPSNESNSSSSRRRIRSKNKRRRDTPTPPRKRNEVTPTKSYNKSERHSSPRHYKKNDTSVSSQKLHKQGKSATPKKTRESSLTPPKSYARNTSSSRSRSRSPTPARSTKWKGHSPKSSRARSSSSSSRSLSSDRNKSKSYRKRDKSVSRSHSRSRSHSKSTINKRGKSRSPKKISRSRSNSRSSHTPSDDERRGQFTVADRKRFWKLHKSRQEEREKEKAEKSPPKEVKPPPGVVESLNVDDIEYGDPPEVEGPNFAELLPPPDQAPVASTSKSKVPLPIKNDGSFLALFKKMQESTKKEEKPEIKKPILPLIGKRRGGRVLKTGMVKKAKAIDEQPADNNPKDAWSLYMQEVKKYRETSCEEERKTRPLVK